MESMEEDGFAARDDHNHNYCAPGGGGDAHVHTDIGKRQLTDVPSPFPQPLPYLPVRGRPRDGAQEKARDMCYAKATITSQLMDSDSSSEGEGSEVCESDSPASSAAGSDTITANSTSKFRKFPSKRAYPLIRDVCIQVS